MAYYPELMEEGSVSSHSGRRRTALVLAGLLALAPVPALAYEEDADCVGKPGTVKVNLTVEGIRSDAGLIALTVYPDDSRRFLRKKGFHYVRRVKAGSPQTRICFILPQPGVYAVAVYHDANANGKLDRGTMGLPTEGFGFSNNASTLLGLPSFQSVRIRLVDGSTTRIGLRYLKKGEKPPLRAGAEAGKD